MVGTGIRSLRFDAALLPTSVPRRRAYFSDHLFARQLHLFPGSNVFEQRQSANTMSNALHGFVTLESIDTYMNCTPVDDDPNCLMETITIPFK